MRASRGTIKRTEKAGKANKIREDKSHSRKWMPRHITEPIRGPLRHKVWQNLPVNQRPTCSEIPRPPHTHNITAPANSLPPRFIAPRHPSPVTRHPSPVTHARARARNQNPSSKIGTKKPRKIFHNKSHFSDKPAVARQLPPRQDVESSTSTAALSTSTSTSTKRSRKASLLNAAVRGFNSRAENPSKRTPRSSRYVPESLWIASSTGSLCLLATDLLRQRSSAVSSCMETCRI